MAEKDLRQELALQAALQRHVDAIVRAATETVTLLQGSGMQNNQLRNVINVAEESESVAVVTNFVRYQIGRSGTGRDWQHKGFGLRIIEDISEGPVRETLDDVLDDVRADIGEDAVTDELARQTHVRLMQHYLGYLNRAFVYANSDAGNTWQNLETAKGA